MVPERWEGDDIGRGLTDASSAAPAIEELVRLARHENWVAEDARAHLGNSIRASLKDPKVRWEGDAVSDSGVYQVDLSYAAGLNRKAVRMVAWSILGSFAEASTHVREEHAEGSTDFHVVTGMPEGSTHFATHGHVVRLRFTQRPSTPA